MSITDKIDAITKITPEYLSVTPPCPKSVKIELTSICNFRCQYCALRTREEKGRHMSLERWETYLRILKDAGVEEIGCFYIGESALHPQVSDAIRIAKEMGFPYVFMTSNGSAFTPEVAKKVMAAGLDSLKFSLNYHDQDQFTEVTTVSGKYFDRMLENIKAAHKIRKIMGFQTKIYASSILYDGEQREKMNKVIQQVQDSIDQHYFLPLYTMGAVAKERELQLGFKPTAGNMGRIGALREPLPCWSVFTEGHLTVDGLLSACCFDASKKWIMGDLNTQTFFEAWHSETFQELRKHHLNKDVTGTVCEKCVAY